MSPRRRRRRRRRVGFSVASRCRWNRPTHEPPRRRAGHDEGGQVAGGGQPGLGRHAQAGPAVERRPVRPEHPQHEGDHHGARDERQRHARPEQDRPGELRTDRFLEREAGIALHRGQPLESVHRAVHVEDDVMVAVDDGGGLDAEPQGEPGADDRQQHPEQPEVGALVRALRGGRAGRVHGPTWATRSMAAVLACDTCRVRRTWASGSSAPAGPSSSDEATA